MRHPYAVADVLNRNEHPLEAYCSNSWQSRTLHAICRCRTAAMGFHLDQCTHGPCGHYHISYNSCRNRHCPTCQGKLREQWIQARKEELLEVPYFHVVLSAKQADLKLLPSLTKEVRQNTGWIYWQSSI